MKIVLYFLFCLVGRTLSYEGKDHYYEYDRESNIGCEPGQILFNPRAVIKYYNITPTSYGTMRKEVYRLNYEHDHHDVHEGGAGIHHISQHLVIYQTGHIVTFGRTSADRLYNFYHGDTAIVYQLDHVTKELKVTKLGFHSNIYFVFVKGGNWVAFDIERHSMDDYALIGATVLLNKYGGEPTWDYGMKNEMLKEFPQHSEIILKYGRE